MIIDKIAVENFGVFQGRQELDLTRTTNARPVTLVGGLNGRGKTTLLDAVQLCLYGKFADCSNRGALSYTDYLKQSSHRYRPDEVSAVELQFQQQTDEQLVEFRVRREWSGSSDVPVETFTVWRDGTTDSFATENWHEIVENIIPRKIAEFFFFDGERIEAYASPEKAAALLRSGIVNLLGIDLVDQLNVDLDLLKSRKAKEIRDDASRTEFMETQKAVDEARREREAVLRQIAQLRTHELPAKEAELLQIESDFSRVGGALFDRSGEIEKLATKVAVELDVAEEGLQQLAFSELPLALVVPLLKKVQVQAASEVSASNSAALIDNLKSRDKEILRLLASQPKSRAAVAQFLEADIERRSRSLKARSLLRANDADVAVVADLVGKRLPSSREKALGLIDQVRRLEHRQAKLEAEKAAIPSHEAVAGLMERRAAVKAGVRALREKLDELLDLSRRLDTVLLRSTQSLGKLAEQKVRDDVASEDSTRTINHANRVQRTLATFRARVIASHIEKIEGYITESFRKIVGKQTLFKTVSISPEDFRVQIKRSDGSFISPDRLSAGERQLFAVSMLWGLARAAGRALPFIIDTPLGRLDSVHRDKLLKHYFPAAGQQVVLLSTDEEIGPDAVQVLSGSVRRYYVIEYDQESRGSTIREGYFKKALSDAA